MLYNRINLVRLLGIALLLDTLAGCGGGGGSSAPDTITVVGRVTDSSGNVLIGVKITESPTGDSATTGSTGSFQLNLPASASETTGTFEFFNASNQLELETQKTITVAAGQTLNLGTTSIGPPAPPVTPA